MAVAIFWQGSSDSNISHDKTEDSRGGKDFGWLRLMEREMCSGIRDMVGVRMIIAPVSSQPQMEIIFFMVHRLPRRWG